MAYLEGVKLNSNDRLFISVVLFIMSFLIGGAILYLSNNGKEDDVSRLKAYIGLQCFVYSLVVVVCLIVYSIVGFVSLFLFFSKNHLLTVAIQYIFALPIALLLLYSLICIIDLLLNGRIDINYISDFVQKML